MIADIPSQSASYSSTASVIPPSPASVYPSNPGNPPPDNNTLDTRGTASPALPDATSSIAPLQNLTTPLPQNSSLASPISLGRVSGPADVQIPLPLIQPSSNIWPPQQTHSVPPTPHGSIPSIPRAAWDVSPYMDNSPASAPATSSQAVYYERAQMDEREPVSAGPSSQQQLANINVP
jgi:hypothetical protein